MRTEINLEGSIGEQSVRLGIPVFIRSKKSMDFTEVDIKDLKELNRLRNSQLILLVTDQEKGGVFYAKGEYSVTNILNNKDSFRIGVPLFSEKTSMGTLTL